MYEQQVSNGIALLNQHFGGPGWVERIDIPRLQLGSLINCVCGQLFGGYAAGVLALGDGSTQKNGFSTPGLYSELTEEWRRQLTEIKVRRRVPAREPVPA